MKSFSIHKITPATKNDEKLLMFSESQSEN